MSEIDKIDIQAIRNCNYLAVRFQNDVCTLEAGVRPDRKDRGSGDYKIHSIPVDYTIESYRGEYRYGGPKPFRKSWCSHENYDSMHNVVTLVAHILRVGMRVRVRYIVGNSSDYLKTRGFEKNEVWLEFTMPANRKDKLIGAFCFDEECVQVGQTLLIE